MKGDSQAVIARILEGKGPSMLLLHGDDFQVSAASKLILDHLVPQEKRAFNLEAFDGRSADWAEIEVALRTPPFFPGTKVIWVENAPYFLSREQKKDLGEKALELWEEGKKEEAARVFQDLLRLEGWTQETWDRLDRAPPAPDVADLFGAEGKEARDAAAEIAEFSRARGMNLRQGGDEGQKLMELVDRDLPSWCFLLISALHVDRRTRLYKKLEEKGATVDLAVVRERSGRIDRDALSAFLDERLKQVGKRIDPQGRETLLLRAGDDLWTVHQELEKLLLYVDKEPSIRPKDVEEAFSDRGGAWVFDLTRSMAERDTVRALSHLASLLSQGEPPLRLLAMIANEARRLLGARSLMDKEMKGWWSKDMPYSQFQRVAQRQGIPLGRNPYGDYMSFKNAENFKRQELLDLLESIHHADIELKSTSKAPRLIMEKLILEMCRGKAFHAGAD